MNDTIRLGSKVRALRRREGLTQARLAEMLDISPAYLNLIEYDRRPLSAPLLIKLAQLFNFDLHEFAAESDARLRSELMEIFSDPLFEEQPLNSADVREMALGSPAVARAVLRLYKAFQEAREVNENLTARISEDMFLSVIERSRVPSEEVSDFIQSRLNYFPELEQAAEELWSRAGLDPEDLFHSLSRYLLDALGIRIQIVAPEPAGAVRRFDPQQRTLNLCESLPPSSRNFQIIHQIALLTQAELIERVARDEILSTEESRRLARVAMANYFAGAVTMPYQPFLDAAERERYDIERLMGRFGVSFEQVCHRLTSLRRPGAEGVPFHFARVDIAGNISKRFSASGIQIPRFGACPRWNLHAAFLTPGQIVTQLSRMPDGAAYFCLACTVSRGAHGFRSPRVVHALTLGCAAGHARRLIYADGVDLDNLDAAVPIGTTCRLCDRMDCEQRAHPPLQLPLQIDENLRGVSFYAPVRPPDKR